jgi:hypothetical protein
MQERDEALGERKRFGQMLYAANEGTATSCVPSCAPCGRCTRNHRTDLRLRRTALRDQEAANDAAARFDPTAVVGWKCQRSSSTRRGPQRSEDTRRAGAERAALM